MFQERGLTTCRLVLDVLVNLARVRVLWMDITLLAPDVYAIKYPVSDSAINTKHDSDTSISISLFFATEQKKKFLDSGNFIVP